MTEWKTYKLGDVATFQTGKLNSNEAVENGKYPFFTCSPNTLSIDTYAFDKEAILLAGNNAEGNFSIKYYKGKFNAYQRTYIIETYNDICDIKYLFYALKLCLQKFKQMSQGTSTKFLTAVILNNFEISLPPLAEQRRIVGILGAIDDKIENNRRINTNLELQAQALFDNLMSNSNVEYKLIADIDHIIETGRRPKGGVANITSGVPSIGAENIKGLGKYDYSKTKYITAEFAETLKKGIIKGYELLIYKDGGKPGYFIPNFSIFGEGFPYDNMTLNEHVFLLDFGNKGYNFFAYFYMQTEEVMKYLNAQGSKAAIPGINRNDVENISIPTIEDEAVKEFCERIEPIITSILVNSKESSRLATLRDTLLLKLMNGEIKTE